MKKTKLLLILLIIILLVSAISIGIGMYLNNISKPKYIFSKGIDIIKNKIDNYTKISNDLDLKDKYSIKGTVEFDLNSDYYKKATDPEEKKIYNKINNLNNMDINFKIQKNQSNDIGYIELNESIKNEKILNAKYFINDSTKYYLIEDILDDYVIAGGCNYFENITANQTEKENTKYIYNFAIDSIKNNLNDKDFTSKEGKDNYLVTLKIDNNSIKDLLRSVIKDLNNDKKSKRILDNIDKKILKTKIKDEDIILEENEYYKVYIYTSKILHKPLKYKVEHFSKEGTKTYIYEGNENKGTLHYILNEAEKYNILLELKNDEIKGKIRNSSNKNIGEFKLEKNNYNTVINYTYNDNNEKIDLIYSSKYTKVKKNEKYNNKKSLSFKHIVNKETKLSGEIDINLEINNKFSIMVDTSNAKLKSNMTKEEKEQIDNLYENIKNRLER